MADSSLTQRPPHLVTAAAVVDRSGTQTLLVLPSDLPRWSFLSDHVEGGEPLGQAVRRQAQNLGGLVRFDVLEPHLAVQQDLVDCGGGDVRHVVHVFAVVADPAEKLATTGDPLQWFAIDTLPQPLDPGVRLHLREAVRMVRSD